MPHGCGCGSARYDRTGCGVQAVLEPERGGEPTRRRHSRLDSHASRLRRKLNAIGGRWVINTRGVGYRLI